MYYSYLRSNLYWVDMNSIFKGSESVKKNIIGPRAVKFGAEM